MTTLLITHDMGVVAESADRVAVMYTGLIMEYGTVGEIFADPRHPYTKGLLACIPRLGEKRQRLETITARDVRIAGSAPGPVLPGPLSRALRPRKRASFPRCGRRRRGIWFGAGKKFAIQF